MKTTKVPKRRHKTSSTQRVKPQKPENITSKNLKNAMPFHKWTRNDRKAVSLRAESTNFMRTELK